MFLKPVITRQGSYYTKLSVDFLSDWDDQIHSERKMVWKRECIPGMIVYLKRCRMHNKKAMITTSADRHMSKSHVNNISG